jgi:dipeptidyl aminopeptidase/acylaminoacyl peptidase
MRNLKSVMVLVLCLLLGCGFLTSCGKKVAIAEPELIPREIVFGNPEKASPRLSPDGTMMSYLAPVDNVLNVWVGTIGKNDVRPATKDTLRGIMRYFWSGDSRHIMYLQDEGGNENWLLWSVSLDSNETVCMTPFENVQVQIVDRNKNFPDELLIGMNKEDPKVHDVYHLDLKTGDLKMVAKNPGNVLDWVTDADFKVRGCLMTKADGGYDFMYRKTEKADWELLVSWGSEEAWTSSPISFTKDGKAVYMLDSRDANAGRLVKMDIAGKQIDVLAEDPQYDVSDVIQNPDSYEIEAVTFVKDRQEVVVLDEAIRADIEAIKKIHHGDFFISSRDDADDTWLVGFDADDGPIPYYSYDRATKKETFLFYHRPKLNTYTLAPMEPFSFTSRDGLTIHGYMTFPPGKGKENLPIVLNVHGGPWHRDSWGYNPEAQWLSNRGYICMQVNFRGSTGYGKDFINAGDKEWAGEMHNDLVDAVNWVVEKGYADPNKVAIYGWSYGGYAALVGATFTPDLFACAIDGCGPSNIITLMQSIPPYWTSMKDIFRARVGDYETEEEFLKSRSPLFRVDSVRIPMMVVQGANDPRVKQAEADQIVQAMKQKGIDHEYLLFPDEGHGLARPENRLKFYAAAEKFLAKHLGGRFEEVVVE